MSMLFPPIDPNERFRERRATARRRKRLRRSAAVGSILLAVLLLGMGAQFVTDGGTEPSADVATLAAAPTGGPRTLPIEIRGVHVTMGLASLPGKLDEYLDLERDGLTALELDVKDENGEIGFITRSIPRQAVEIGAAREYYDAPQVAKRVDARGIYLIGRVVLFEDPMLSRGRSDLAIQRSDGSVWTDAAGLGWTNPYDKRVWRYNVDVAVAAAKAGFDEIMFDYVRFPSDGDVESAVYRNRGTFAKREVVPAFLRYAKRRLDPFDVRISAAVFGLSATRDLGIGQIPRQMAPYLDTVYTMTYPSLFGPGELGLQDPGAAPGATVARALRRFELAVRGRDVHLVPWVQDFSFAIPYDLDKVRAQIYSARIMGAKGYLLWNAEGLYTDGALTPPS